MPAALFHPITRFLREPVIVARHVLDGVHCQLRLISNNTNGPVSTTRRHRSGEAAPHSPGAVPTKCADAPYGWDLLDASQPLAGQAACPAP